MYKKGTKNKVNKTEKAEIEKLLKDRKSLICDKVFEISFQKVKEILGMPKWEEEKFQGLLTSTIWNSSAKDVKEILGMTEWEEEKFQGLLTSNIWNSSAKDVKKKIHMECWKDERYKHLLKPSIFSVSTRNIEKGIELSEEYNFSSYITINFLRKNLDDQRIIIKYMIANKIDLIIDDERCKNKKILNPILSAANSVLKRKYKIDIDKIKKENKKGEDYVFSR